LKRKVFSVLLIALIESFALADVDLNNSQENEEYVEAKTVEVTQQVPKFKKLPIQIPE
jgi:hypothetical protein